MPSARAASARSPSLFVSARRISISSSRAVAEGEILVGPIDGAVDSGDSTRCDEVEIVSPDDIAAHQRGDALHRVLQLADIARATHGEQSRRGVRREPLAAATRARKCSASGTMSADRSRSGGRCIGTTCRR